MTALHNTTRWGLLGLGLALLLAVNSGCANQFDTDELEFRGENQTNNPPPEDVRAQCISSCTFITNNCNDEVNARCGPEFSEGFTPESCPAVCNEDADVAELIVSVSANENCDDIAGQLAIIAECTPENNGGSTGQCAFDDDCAPDQGCVNDVCLVNCLNSGDCGGMPLCNTAGDFCARPDEACFAACFRVAISCPEELEFLCDDPYPGFFDDCNNFCSNPSPGALDLGQSFFATDCFDTTADATAIIPAAQDQCIP